MIVITIIVVNTSVCLFLLFILFCSPPCRAPAALRFASPHIYIYIYTYVYIERDIEIVCVCIHTYIYIYIYIYYTLISSHAARKGERYHIYVSSDWLSLLYVYHVWSFYVFLCLLAFKGRSTQMGEYDSFSTL